MIALAHPDARLVDAATGAVLAGPALAAAVELAAEGYDRHPPGMVLALMPTSVEAVVGYLAALRAGRPVALLDPALPPAVLADLVARYRPALVTGVSGAAPEGYAPADSGTGRFQPLGSAGRSQPLSGAWVRAAATPEPPPPHPDLALLLPTSGSTGSPKLVRLSRAAVVANADAIADALGIDGAEVAPTSLPLFYSYGMSVLNSHLRRGATVVLERAGLVAREFWTAVETYRCTTLAAVPYQYEILRRLRFDPARHPSLHTLTQAGGRLAPELVLDFHARMAAAGGKLFVMYGQTEAGPRITTLPADRLPEKLGSVGPAIPGGRLSTRPDGEVVYSGPNVMMGYAETAEDLARGDDLGGTLATGDLGHLDDEGYLFLTGRVKRIAKVFGVRVNLDEVERLVPARVPLAAVPGEDRIHVYAEGADAAECALLRAELADRLGTHSSGVDVRAVDRLPLLPNGKIDYRALC